MPPKVFTVNYFEPRAVFARSVGYIGAAAFSNSILI